MGRLPRSSNRLTACSFVAVACCVGFACGGAQKTRESKAGYAAFVVELNATASAKQIRRLSLLGLRADANNSFGGHSRVFRMTEPQLEQVRALPFVVSVERLKPTDKYDAGSMAAATDPVLVTIDTFDHLGDDQREAVAAFVKAHNGVIRWVSRATLRAEVPRALIAALAQLDPVVWIEPATASHGPTP